jgi:hypothetical protein
MNYRVLLLVCLVATLAVAAPIADRPDFIALRNGQTARTRVLDVMGCKVTIERNGSRVPVEKALIEYIVCGPDTIWYDSFVCDEQGVKAVKYRETGEYRLWVALDKACRSPAPLNRQKGDLTVFVARPLYGTLDTCYVNPVAAEARRLLAQAGHVLVDVKTDWLAEHFGDPKSVVRYVVATKEYLDMVDSRERSGSIDFGGAGGGMPHSSMVPDRVKTSVATFAELVVADVRAGRVLLDTACGSEDVLHDLLWNSGHGIFSSAGVDQNWHDHRVDRSQEQGAGEVARRVLHVLRSYMGLPDE